MSSIKLTENQVREIVGENRYKVDPSKKFFSRCIDGRYENGDELAVQAFPGADVGELAMVMAAARVFGFEIDREKVFKSLTEVLGSEKDFGYHTDSHADQSKIAAGCGHYKQINLDPAAYSISAEDIGFIDSKLKAVKSKGAKEIILQGDHAEGAILMVKGNWAIKPRFELEMDGATKLAEVFVYHQSLTDEKHRLLAEKLMKNKAVKFKLGEDKEYLYEILSETAENHLLETAKRLAPDLPIFEVEFDDDGSYKIKAL